MFWKEFTLATSKGRWEKVKGGGSSRIGAQSLKKYLLLVGAGQVLKVHA